MGLFPRKNPDVGNTSDSAVTSDTSGTQVGFLRGLVKILADLWDTTNHALYGRVFLGSQLTGSYLTSTIAVPADGEADIQSGLWLGGSGPLRFYTRPQKHNGTTWDKERNNAAVTVLASASRTTTAAGTSADLTSYNGRRLALIVNVSDATGGGSITPSLQLKDSISGNYVTVWTASAALVAASTSAYLFADGVSGGSWTEKLAFGVPGRTYRIVCTANNASALIYSVSAEVMV